LSLSYGPQTPNDAKRLTAWRSQVLSGDRLDPDGDDLGDDGLLDALARIRHGTAAEACGGIANDVRNYVRD